MARETITVVRGGPSEEYDVSLATGRRVLDTLSRDRYESTDVTITRAGEWLVNGLVRRPEDILARTDVVVNALHGAYGEDGKVQRLFEMFGVPYTGSRVVASALGMNKWLARAAFRARGITLPRAVALSSDEPLYERAYDIFRSFPFPAFVKPSRGGSSFGVSLAESLDDLLCAIEYALPFSGSVVIEERIAGCEVTCGIIENFRGERLYAVPPAEISWGGGERFFSTRAKYGGGAFFRAPAPLAPSVKRDVERLARAAHEAIGARHYSRSDFIISPRGGIYILEINTLPGLSSLCSFPRLLESVGSSVGELIEHLIAQARRRE